MNLTQHAMKRLAQRNIKMNVFGVIRKYASPVNDGFLFTSRDARDAIVDHPSLREDIARCVNVAMIIDNETMITVMRANRRKQQALMRR